MLHNKARASGGSPGPLLVMESWLMLYSRYFQGIYDVMGKRVVQMREGIKDGKGSREGERMGLMPEAGV